MINLAGRSLLTLFDYSQSEIHYLLDYAFLLKEKKQRRESGDLLKGKNIALIFNKPSTRTRCAFEVAIFDESGCASMLTNSQMNYKESIEDTAKVLGRLYDGIGFRGSAHYEVELLAQHSGIPVWNALTDEDHPTQVLADLMTIREYIHKPWHDIKMVYVGDGRNNMARSLMIGAAKMGMSFINLSPKALWPEVSFLDKIAKVAAENQANVQCSDQIVNAVRDADILYTDVWASMGEEKNWAQRIALLQGYQVNQAMLESTQNSNIFFMHCLPAFHDLNTEVGQKINAEFGLTSMEVSDEVFKSRHSLVFEQAENRLHTLKAVILATLAKA